MKLESSQVEESGGMMQAHIHLVFLRIQLVELTKGKEKHEQFLCSECRNKGHQKDEFLTFDDWSTESITRMGVLKDM
jgi:hypothetical protein